jgi:hypothetical protein
MTHRLLLALVLFVSLTACEKEASELPPETQTGANTFGARVNGEIWVPQGFGIVPTAPLLEASWVLGNMYIRARNFSRSPRETEFEFYLRDVTGPGTYTLNTTSSYPTLAGNYGYFVRRNLTPTNEFMTSAQYNGTVTITRLDTVNFIVSGRFQFAAADIFGNDPPMTVSDGRFDIDFY